MSNLKYSEEKNKSYFLYLLMFWAQSLSLYACVQAYSKNTFDIIIESELIAQNIWISYFLVKWVVFEWRQYVFREKKITVFPTWIHVIFHNFIVTLCCKNRQLNARTICTYICKRFTRSLSLQSMDLFFFCIILFRSKNKEAFA